MYNNRYIKRLFRTNKNITGYKHTFKRNNCNAVPTIYIAVMVDLFSSIYLFEVYSFTQSTYNASRMVNT